LLLVEGVSRQLLILIFARSSVRGTATIVPTPPPLTKNVYPSKRLKREAGGGNYFYGSTKKHLH